MRQQNTSVIFDQTHAEQYDERFAKLAPLRDSLHLLVGAVFADQPADARILCVGAGTGSELIYLATRFPRWTFTAVEPSAPMLDVCRRRTEALGLATRCVFHHGFLNSLPLSEAFDAATSLLVSHFILSSEGRANFFRAIAERLRPGGCFASADLASDIESLAYESLLKVWLRMMKDAVVPAEQIKNLHESYGRDVAIWPPEQISAIIAAGGFEMPVTFFQAGLIHAWYAQRNAVAMEPSRRS